MLEESRDAAEKVPVYEIPVAVHVTPAFASEQVELRAMIRESFKQSPQLAARCRDFSAGGAGQRRD